MTLHAHERMKSNDFMDLDECYPMFERSESGSAFGQDAKAEPLSKAEGLA